MANLIQIKTENLAVLTKLQKQFNARIKKINTLKNKIILVEAEITEIQIKISSEILPLEKKLLEIRINEIISLDTLFQKNVLKKRDNKTLSEIIMGLTENIISGFQSEELKNIFTRHNGGVSFEEAEEKEKKEAAKNLKNTFSSIFGIIIDEEADFSSTEKFQEYIDQQFETEKEAYEAKKTNQKKTLKQIEKEEKKRQEAKNLNKTIRQIYMELVRAFHPDREQNELEKGRKTLLMQKITQAYEADDLFDLLRLRLELLGTDFEHSNDENLKYYIKLLNQQIFELEDTLTNMLTFGQSSLFGSSLYERFGSDIYQSLEQKFKKEISRLKKGIREGEKEILLYRDSIHVKYLIDNYQEQKNRWK